MTQALTSSVAVELAWLLSEADDLDTPKVEAYRRVFHSFASGSGSGQANKLFRDSRSLAASASETLDLSALTENIIGDSRTVAFATVRALLVVNTSTPSDSILTVTTSGTSDPLTALFGGAAGTQKLGPGDAWLFTRRLAGITVDSGNKDLKFTNSDNDATTTYDLIIIGT